MFDSSEDPRLQDSSCLGGVERMPEPDSVDEHQEGELVERTEGEVGCNSRTK